ncbi:hypothetical protein GGQ22_15600 [Nocardioides sp. zg-579]|uniref:Uncharacterized protein n=1 Tax=Nocardioides marmotae TaxID=2663857 RepID=A0A6I3JEJ4_9ACTN|nr:hypothetical protein [Nocardioides marmotae]MCR6032849.1 hypothetical protein [Gordonia jinghuaiqii]MTB96499.1 hypothetical protein [Nocardioides marmotae]QKE01979.1 hypothetical protein HPC71_13530 [Nocardioides marmotae]
MVVEKGFRCTITVEVLNLSGRTVHVDHAVAPFAGPQTGTVVTVDTSHHPQPERRRDLDHSGDAYLEISGGLDLEAGDQGSFDVHLVFNRRGCNRGVTAYVEGWPEVTFSVLGRSFERPAANTFAIHGKRSPGCRD